MEPEDKQRTHQLKIPINFDNNNNNTNEKNKDITNLEQSNNKW